jgi:hypothetical protein
MNKCGDCDLEIEKYENNIEGNIICDNCKEKRLSEHLKNKFVGIQSEIDKLELEKESIRKKWISCNTGIYEKEGILN